MLSGWGIYSLCDVPALGWRWIIANWTPPSRGKMSHRVASVKSSRPHTGIAVGLLALVRLFGRYLFSLSLLFQIIRNKHVRSTFFSNRCLFKYMEVLKTRILIMFFFIVMWFRFYVSLLYLMFHLSFDKGCSPLSKK